jgi:hypothetical protein
MITNPLPGNRHFAEGNRDNGNENYNLTQAVLALAFEQRTANLIAALQPVRLVNNRELAVPYDRGVAVADEISRRLDI